MPTPTHFRSDGWVKSAQGAAVSGAQIYVCTQPANVSAVPPTPLVDIFEDPNGLVPITQPILTDGFGHYDFYVAPGTYTVLIALGGVAQQVYEDQSIGLGTGSSGSGLVIQVEGEAAPNQGLLNFLSSDTSQAQFSTDSEGALSLTLTPSIISSSTEDGTAASYMSCSAFNDTTPPSAVSTMSVGDAGGFNGGSVSVSPVTDGDNNVEGYAVSLGSTCEDGEVGMLLWSDTVNKPFFNLSLTDNTTPLRLGMYTATATSGGAGLLLRVPTGVSAGSVAGYLLLSLWTGPGDNDYTTVKIPYHNAS